MMMGTRIEDDIETYIQTSYLIVKQEKEWERKTKRVLKKLPIAQSFFSYNIRDVLSD